MNSYKARLDGISVVVSFLCLVHCIILPVLLTTLPIWGFEVLENRYIEAATLLTSLFIGGFAIWKGYKKFHHRISILLLFLGGIMLMTVATVTPDEMKEIVLKCAGALLVVSAHIKNRNSCRRCSHCPVEADKQK